MGEIDDQHTTAQIRIAHPTTILIGEHKSGSGFDAGQYLNPDGR
jgi:hypothetical protein